ncbi:O-antigen ligase [Geothrix sp. PMB-07]|uniref:O-antigen ligase family protein n=1 Tax=Geothrix sp. PMB-07 TaxID=3068640 RepID=UPI0027403E20|nr:O-antigen ligase family protein [Geothrix sp. PMB-07]WLT30169.1 O-antigen ligase family protein [Geothrix sp. PMB-07]
MVIILTIMIEGALPSIIYVSSRNTLWLVWAIFFTCIIILGLQLWLPRLIRPALPLVAWLTIYICWGTLAAPYPILASGLRLWFRFLCIIGAMAIVTSHPRRFRFFANATQWGLLGNLLVTMWLISFPEYQQHPFFLRINATLGSDRFAGLWGNANEAGLAALFLLVLSFWASRWIAWLGRISGVLIIYLTASRTAFWIAIMLALLYLIFAASKKRKVQAVLVATVLLLFGVGFLSSSKGGGFSFIKESPTLSRVLDLSESKTRERGEESRMDLAKQWLPFIAREPWYGYGLYSAEGDESKETLTRRGFPGQGTHNLYMALFVDAGWVGLLTFLATIAFHISRTRQQPLEPSVHRMLFALCFILLAFSLANHQMLTDFTGWIGFSLLFLLPMSPALRDLDHFDSSLPPHGFR